MIKTTVQKFFKRVCDPKKAVLLALSGGPDSLALFHVMKELGVNMALAHVDHGWRSTSGKEADKLKELGYPLHLKTLRMEGSTNLEDRCREERLAFFKELCATNGYQAVVLGHQKDEQVETVLKRVLEGASLYRLKAMGEISEMSGMQVWRPLLKIPKKEILDYCGRHKLTPFDDPSNRDPKFLRARMRTELIPTFFGKEVANPLCRIAHEARELNDFLEELVSEELSSAVKTPYGTLIDLSKSPLNATVPLKYLLKKFLPFPADQLEKGVRFIQTNAANKRLIFGGQTIYFDRRRLFFGSLPEGPWEITQKMTDEEVSMSDWKDILKGEVRAVLPPGDYTFEYRTLNKWWNSHKAPAFLRQCLPVVLQKNRVVYEFLTGKIKDSTLISKNREEKQNMVISLKSSCLCGIISGVRK